MSKDQGHGVPQTDNRKRALQIAEFDHARWLTEKVQPNVTALLAKPEEWPGWRASLLAAVLKDVKVRNAVASDPLNAMVQVIKCARLGLSPEPGLMHFFFEVRDGVLGGQVMYRGWQHLAMESGAVEWIEPQVIYRQEELGNPIIDPITRRVNHVPRELERDQWSEDKDIVGAYCMAKLRGRERLETIVLSRGNLDKRERLSRGPAYRNWRTQMYLAKAIKALCSSGRLPLTKRVQEEIEQAMRLETAPSPVAAPSLPPPPPPAPKPTGQQVLFQKTDEDPLPDDVKLHANFVAAIDAETTRRELNAEKTTDLVKQLIPVPENWNGDVAYLPLPLLRQLFDALCPEPTVEDASEPRRSTGPS